MNFYKCECGKEFESAPKFNGHKSHCKIHLDSVGKLDAYVDRQARACATGRAAYNKQRKAKKQQLLELWVAEQHKCERCGKVMTEKFGSGRFCSRTCANIREHSEETRNKIRASVQSSIRTESKASKLRYEKVMAESQAAYENNAKKCSVCGQSLPYEKRFRKTCCNECERIALSNAGKNSASVTVRRSKNEIAFCDLCESYFGKENVLHNEPMFNGWDADIIILEYKLAILWNGPWHYRKVTKSHSLEQVQTRDKIKQDQIKLCGFTPYIIKDDSKFSLNTVNAEFTKFIEYIRNF